VDQVERVHENGADAELDTPLAEGLEVLRVVVREPPCPRTLDEELQRIHVELSAPVERFLDPAGTVGAEEHDAYATARAATLPAPPPRAARRPSVPPLLLGVDDLVPRCLRRGHRPCVRRPGSHRYPEADLSGCRLRRPPDRERRARALRRRAFRPVAPQPD